MQKSICRVLYCILYISSYGMLHRTMTCPIPLYFLLCILILSWHITLYLSHCNRESFNAIWRKVSNHDNILLLRTTHSCAEYSTVAPAAYPIYRSTRTMQRRILGILFYLLVISERLDSNVAWQQRVSCINRILLITNSSNLFLSWHPDGIEK